MIVNRFKGIKNIVAAVEMAAAYSLFWAYYFVFEAIYGTDKLASERDYLIYSLAITIGLLLYFLRNSNSDWGLAGGFKVLSLAQSFRQTLYAAFSIFILMVSLKAHVLSRIFLFTYLPLLFCVLAFLNYRMPYLACQMFFQKHRRLKTLLIGPSAKSIRLNQWLKQMQDYGLEPVGLISDEETSEAVGNMPVLGGMDDIKRIVVSENVRYIILLQIPRLDNVLAYLMNLTEEHGIRMMALNDLSDTFKRPLSYFNQGGLDFITMRDEPLEDPLNRALKRSLDICISLPVVLFILPPLFILTWLAQRFQSPGSILYQQIRGGLKNESFMIYKLRTMHPANAAPTAQATKNDPRIYPFGRFLRKTSLDEFPQFINVLLGQMSIVGPRPHMLEHNEIFAQAMQTYHTRTYVKPGLTGLAQVQGQRGESKRPEDIVSRVQSDIEYLENWSFFLDVKLICRTVVLVFFPPDNAY